MKTLLYILCIVLCISCSSDVTDNKPNNDIQKIKEFSRVMVTEGAPSHQLNLDEYFKSNSPLAYTATSSDTGVARVSIIEKRLVIQFLSVGESTIALTVSLGDVSETLRFAVQVLAKDDTAPTVVNPIADMKLFKNGRDSSFTLSNVFHDEDGDVFRYTVSTSNTNITATLLGETLTLSFKRGAEGTTKITLRAIANNISVSHSFTVTLLDRAPIVSGSISNIQTYLNAEDTTFSIGDLFTDPDGDVLSYTVNTSNAARITAQINGTDVHVSYKEGIFGTEKLTIKAIASGLFVMKEITITIIDNSASILSDASIAFQNEEYEEAIRLFTQLKNHETESVALKSYVGLGYSYMRKGVYASAKSAFIEGLSKQASEGKNDVKAGLAFLEYSVFDQYQNAVNYCLDVLQSSNAFEMMYDTTINHKDVRLTLAQSYFQLKQYSDCLEQVKQLGKLQNTNDSDSELTEKLLHALKTLSEELK